MNRRLVEYYKEIGLSDEDIRVVIKLRKNRREDCASIYDGYSVEDYERRLEEVNRWYDDLEDEILSKYDCKYHQ